MIRPDSMIRYIVGRRHVSESDRAVIGYVVSRLRGGRRAFLKFDRAKRRAIMAHTIVAHRENQILFGAVQGARIDDLDDRTWLAAMTAKYGHGSI